MNAYWELWDRRPNTGPGPDLEWLRDQIELGLRGAAHLVSAGRSEESRRARFAFDIGRAAAHTSSLPYRWTMDEQTARRRPGPLGGDSAGPDYR